MIMVDLVPVGAHKWGLLLGRPQSAQREIQASYRRRGAPPELNG